MESPSLWPIILILFVTSVALINGSGRGEGEPDRCVTVAKWC